MDRSQTSFLGVLLAVSLAASSAVGAPERADQHWRAFERYCLSSPEAPLRGLETAASDGFKPFLLPGFVQNNAVGMNVLIMESDADGGAICQVVDRTLAYDDPDAVVIERLRERFPEFDPASVDLAREVPKYVYEANGALFKFTSQANAEKGSSAFAVIIPLPNEGL